MQEELLTLVRRESDFTRRYYQTLWALPVEERVAEGRCLAGLEYRREEDGRYRFDLREENRSDFREGDLVRLSLGDPQARVVDGVVFRIEDDWIILEIRKKGFRPEQELGSEVWTLDASYFDLTEFYVRAIDQLGQTVRGRERILPLLEGHLQPEVDADVMGEAGEAAEKEGADDAQSEAIAMGVATDLCHLIQGPPGTGKTYALAQVVRQRVARGERVVVSALTHRAIHQALNTIQEVAPEITDMAKIGFDVYDPGLKVPRYETFAEAPFSKSEGGYVVGTTPFSLRGKRFAGADFDCLIMDEASQITLPLAVMAMLSAECYLFVGDHQQLPPVLQTFSVEESVGYSIFSHLEGNGFCTMLETTYRMNDELTHWPGSQFYHGRLKASAKNARRRLVFPQALRQFESLLDPEVPLVLAEMAHSASMRTSREEATTVAGVIAALWEAGVPLSEVAVVVPFRRQAREIRRYLRARVSIPATEMNACVIDTVERMQGQQRDVILVSMTASEPGYLVRLVPFILQPQRLNVAVTRARSKTILFASREIARFEAHDPALQECLDLWLSLRDQCHVVEI